MANSGNCKSRWEGGDLVFRNLAGDELLRIGAGVSINGVAVDLTGGTDGQLLTVQADLSVAPEDAAA